MDIKILLADDHKLVREGLCSLIDQEDDLCVVAQSETGRQAIWAAQKYKPDIVILDINMPELNGIDAAKQILKTQPDIKVIALSVYSSRRFVTGMLKAGASGYLVKDCAFEELTTAVRLVARGQSYLSQQIHDVLIKDFITFAPENQSVSSILTPREREVLQLIAEGLKSEEIASRIFVSIKTVSSHRQQIMKKLNMNSVAELTKLAIKEGLTSIDT